MSNQTPDKDSHIGGKVTEVNKHLIDFTEIKEDGELWELFSRDFLQEIGFYIENQPNRGADGGKDLLITEELSGTLNKYRFRWLVSCKNHAQSNKSVSDRDELNILERMKNFQADGFIGFYSTIASTGLNNALDNLKKYGSIKDFRIFDSKLIENYLIRIGFSKLLMRYFPLSYKKVKPIHLMGKQFIGLHCLKCGRELLESLNHKPYDAVFALVDKLPNIEVSNDNKDNYKVEVIDAYWACKGDCDRVIRFYYRDEHKGATEWFDISELIIPAIFVSKTFLIIDQVKTGRKVFSEKAYEKVKYFFKAMSQKVFREMTEDEIKRAGSSFDDI